MSAHDEADGFLLASVLDDDASALDRLSGELYGLVRARRDAFDALDAAGKQLELQRLVAQATGHGALGPQARGLPLNVVRALGCALDGAGK